MLIASHPLLTIGLNYKVRYSQIGLPLYVLINSGTDDNFIVSELCSQANLPINLKCWMDNHLEVISLYVIPSSSALILELLRLKLDNPLILDNWRTVSVTTEDFL